MDIKLEDQLLSDDEDIYADPIEPPIIKKISTQLASQMQAKEYYETQKKHTVTERQFSRVIEVKKFQNWIKAVQINIATGAIKDNLRKKNTLLNILELGCGKGGDLGKWQIAGVGVWFGVDISGSSLDEALNRYKSSKYDFIIHLLQASADTQNLQLSIPEEFYFDIVSMQFVANLIFSNERSVNQLFENITSKLSSQGLLLLTVTDANVLVKKMREFGKQNKEGAWIYENEHFSIVFDSLEFTGSPYGLKYNFYLEDSVGEKNETTGQITYVPEYLIELKEFERKANEYGLEIIENLNFTEVYHRYKDRYFDLMSKIMNIGQDEWTMKDIHWEISHLYRFLILRQVKGVEQSRIKRKSQLEKLYPKTTISLDK